MKAQHGYVLIIVGLALLAVVLGGCTTFQKGDLRYSNFIFDKKVQELSVETSPDGTTKATLKGVQSGLNPDALKAVAEGAAAGAVKAVNPAK